MSKLIWTLAGAQTSFDVWHCLVICFGWNKDFYIALPIPVQMTQAFLLSCIETFKKAWIIICKVHCLCLQFCLIHMISGILYPIQLYCLSVPLHVFVLQDACMHILILHHITLFQTNTVSAVKLFLHIEVELTWYHVVSNKYKQFHYVHSEIVCAYWSWTMWYWQISCSSFSIFSSTLWTLTIDCI